VVLWADIANYQLDELPVDHVAHKKAALAAFA
jgi:hypothetical protein